MSRGGTAGAVWTVGDGVRAVPPLAARRYLAQHLRAAPGRAEAKDLITWDISVDSTVCRAHQHAAGARKKGDLQVDPPGGGHDWSGVVTSSPSVIGLGGASLWDSPGQCVSPEQAASEPRTGQDAFSCEGDLLERFRGHGGGSGHMRWDFA